MPSQGFGYPPAMNNKTLMVWAVVALLVGVIGMVVVSGFFGGPAVGGSFSSTGQQIFYTGATSAGPIPRTVAGGGMTGLGMMGNVACVDCHGEDGRGGRVGMMFGSVDIPDIRYSTLSTTRSEEGTTIPAWTDSDIARAIRDGIEPNGQPLKAPMPRWAMTDAEIAEAISYLKELSAR
jgi:cytochrome c oxidase subunit 2